MRRDSGRLTRTVPGERGSIMHKTAYGLVALLLMAGVAVQQGWLPDLSQVQSVRTPGSSPPPSGPGLLLSDPAVPPAVLDPATGEARPKPAVVQKLLAAAAKKPLLGRRLGLIVERLGSPRPLMQIDASTPVTPASTVKLLTSMAVLRELSPQHRFSTRVVPGRTARSIVLVGGGDPLLTDATPSRAQAQASYPAQASLQSLAERAAKKLRQEGVRRVRLSYDTSLFSGPAVNPTWEPTYLADNVVSPITSLWVDEGRSVSGYAQRVPDPAAEAAARFAAFLTKAGVRVTGAAQPGRATKVAPLASVESAPLAQIVQHVLEVSDNEGAEVLLRQAAIGAGRAGSFRAGVAVIERQLTELGVDSAGVTIHDGSGLSRQDKLPVRVLADVLQLAAADDHPELRPLISALPVAGFTGSLAYRFVEEAPAGLGVVRAKTGTLTGVHGLAGIVTTTQGTPLVFAFVADRVRPSKKYAAPAQLDRIAALLATCGC